MKMFHRVFRPGLLVLLFLGPLCQAEPKTAEELQADQRRLEAQAAQLAEEYKSLPRVDAIVSGLPLDQLSSDELEAAVQKVIEAKRRPKESPLKRVPEAEQALDAYSASLADFQGRYDRQVAEEFLHILDRYQGAVDTLANHEGMEGAPQARKRAQEILAELQETEAGIRKELGKANPAMSMKVVKNGRKYFAGVKDLLNLNVRQAATRGERFTHSLKGVSSTLKSMGRLVPTALRIPVVLSRILRNKPFGDVFAPPAGDYLANQGFDWQVQGNTDLSKPAVLLANHASFLDYFTQIGMEQDVMHLYNGSAAPTFIQKILAGRPQMVGVGGGRKVMDPRDQVRRNVRDHGVGSMYVYPEGNTGVGLNRDTQRPNPGFMRKIFPLLREQGPIALRPVTNPDNYRTLETTSATPVEPAGQLRTVYGDGIPPKVVDYLFATGREDLMNGMVRQAWIETIADSLGTEDEPLGRHSVGESARRIDATLDHQIAIPSAAARCNLSLAKIAPQ